MANALITPSIIAKEALVQLENNLVFGNMVHREYRNEFSKKGDTISIRRPVQFEVTDGATLSKQDVEEGKIALTVDQRKHVGWSFVTQDLTLTIEQYSERYIKPAAIQLANNIDSALAGMYKQVYNHVGTPGTTPSTFSSVSPASQRLDDQAVPDDGKRYLAMGPAAAWSIAGAQTALELQQRSERAYASGEIGDVAGLRTWKSQNVKTHTVGDHGGTPLVDGGSQNVTYASVADTNQQTLVTDGWDTSVDLKEGDVFTIDDVYAVNPVSKETLPYLQQFVLRADVTTNASASADTNLTISPPIITSGPQQTVSAAPANNAPINYVGTANTGYPQNLAFHRNAFALVTVPLQMPDGASFKAQENKNGYSIRVVKDYDISTDEEIIRLDVLYGVKAIDPRLACRLTG